MGFRTREKPKAADWKSRESYKAGYESVFATYARTDLSDEDRKNREQWVLFSKETNFENPIDAGPVFVHDDRLDSDGEERIRLLELLPGQSRDVVRCKLHTVALANAPSYRALSYCWGSDANPQAIVVNGRVLKITQNLRSGLRHVRSKTVSIYIWADAICMNQGDVDEKNRQLALMPKIYAASSNTVIWIGPLANEYDVALVTCSILARAAEAERLGASSNPAEDVEWESWEKPLAKGCLDARKGPTWNSDVLKLVRRPWFGRIWVVQEAILSPRAELYCGFESMDWSVFQKAITYGFGKRLFVPLLDRSIWLNQTENAHMLIPTRRDHGLLHPAEVLLVHLMEFRGRQASSPVDKVFALLGLADGVERYGIRADYGSSVDSVFREVTVKLLQATRNLDILGFVSADPDRHWSSSWLADWTTDGHWVEPLGHPGGDLPRVCRATGTSAAKPRFEDGDATLVLHGYEFGEVDAVSGVLPMQPHREAVRYTKAFSDFDEAELDKNKPWTSLRWAKTILLSMVRYWEVARSRTFEVTSTLMEWEVFADARREDGPTRETYWRTLCTGHYLDGDQALTGLEFSSWFDMLQGHRRAAEMPFGIGKKSKTAAMLRQDKAKSQRVSRFPEVLRFAFGRRLARIDGRIALVPPTAQPGDVLLLCQGASVPLLARRDGASWILLGESYLTEIMQGQAFDEGRCQELRFK